MGWNPFDTLDKITGGIADKIFKPAEDMAGGIFNKMTGNPSAADKRAQAAMVNAQLQAYRDATELTQNEINRKRGEEAVEKRRIEEKQIRGLRNSYRPAGFLDAGDSELSNKLGGN